VKRPRVQAEAAPGAAEASFWLGEYLDGKRSELPWEAMGLAKAPVMAGAPPSSALSEPCTFCQRRSLRKTGGPKHAMRDAALSCCQRAAMRSGGPFIHNSGHLIACSSLPAASSVQLLRAGEELDVRALHATVQAHGGYDAVTKGRLWARIAGGLAIPLDYQNAGTVLRCIPGDAARPTSLTSSVTAVGADHTGHQTTLSRHVSLLEMDAAVNLHGSIYHQDTALRTSVCGSCVTAALCHCRGHYQRLLLRHDRQVSAARSYSTRQATAAASAVSDTPPQRSASSASRAAEASDAGDAPPSPALDEAAQQMDVVATTSSAPAAAVHTAAAPAEAANTTDIVVEAVAAGASQSCCDSDRHCSC
jgi:ARID/BRIGHT DNA binding domain